VSVLRRIPRKAVPAALFHKQQNSEKRVTILLRGLVAGLIASVPLALSTELFAGGEWPDGPNKHWFQGLKRPDNAKHPRLGERRRRDERKHEGKGRFHWVNPCLGHYWDTGSDQP